MTFNCSHSFIPLNHFLEEQYNFCKTDLGITFDTSHTSLHFNSINKFCQFSLQNDSAHFFFPHPRLLPLADLSSPTWIWQAVHNSSLMPLGSLIPLSHIFSQGSIFLSLNHNRRPQCIRMDLTPHISFPLFP